MNDEKIGILLINLGTPAAPDVRSIKKYLAEFLSDPRIVALPKLFWFPFLHGVILNIRPRQKVKDYQKIWTTEGSPLLVNTKKQHQELQHALDPEKKSKIVKYAMRYGEPKIQHVLKEFKDEHIERILVLPLFPQYSTATYESICDVLNDKAIVDLEMITNRIRHYYDHPDYIRSLTCSIREHWQQHKNNYLLFSFHGLPEKFITTGDPYQNQCALTADLVAKELGIEPHQWSYAFQSRFGKAAWIKPDTTDVLKKLPTAGIKNVSVICPGFAADCLETLEEINILNREHFVKAGGERFEYIPALNDRDDHIQMMLNLINQYQFDKHRH